MRSLNDLALERADLGVNRGSPGNNATRIVIRLCNLTSKRLCLTMQELWKALGFYERGYVVMAALSAYGAVVWVVSDKIHGAIKR